MPDQSTVPAFHGNINFNAQHSPMGAFFSFTCGHFGTRGGFGAQIGKPGNQDLYIGIKNGDRFSTGQLTCLPFYEGAKDDPAAAFLVEQQITADPLMRKKVIAYPKEQIQRHYGWATDQWATPDFKFTIYTPFGSIPEPSDGTVAQLPVLPAILAELIVDNSKGMQPKTAFFATGFTEPGMRLFETKSGARGYGWRKQFGVRAAAITGDGFTDVQPFLFCRWAPDQGLLEKNAHGLGSCPGIGITVPAGAKMGLRFALAAYLDGVVTTGLEGRYLYTRAFGSLETVLDVALAHGDALKNLATQLDERLLASGLSADQQFLIAHSTRSYYGSTQLLEVGGQPFWIVNEGEYCMMNTLDLSVDQLFWELEQNPWVVRNLLDNFARFYSYHDQVKSPKSNGQLSPGGISFSHDMGIHNNFSPFGNSSYELANLPGCFSYMTCEQLCNWSLLAAGYVAKTKDLHWAKHNDPVLLACFESLIHRCKSGYIDHDSSRCESGQEITTYDSLDESLGQARANLYLSVKCWAALQGLRMIHRFTHSAADSFGKAETDQFEAAIASQAGTDGVLPAVFEKENKGHDSRILAAIEGLVYARCWQSPREPIQPSPFQDALRKHTAALLNDSQRRNLFSDGGLKLSSTSNNSWMSKIAIFQHVSREVLHLDDDPKVADIFRDADAAHVKWQTEGASAFWAMSDQMVSGVACGSKYYPRCITTALWLSGHKVRV